MRPLVDRTEIGLDGMLQVLAQLCEAGTSIVAKTPQHPSSQYPLHVGWHRGGLDNREFRRRAWRFRGRRVVRGLRSVADGRDHQHQGDAGEHDDGAPDPSQQTDRAGPARLDAYPRVGRAWGVCVFRSRVAVRPGWGSGCRTLRIQRLLVVVRVRGVHLSVLQRRADSAGRLPTKTGAHRAPDDAPQVGRRFLRPSSGSLPPLTEPDSAAHCTWSNTPSGRARRTLRSAVRSCRSARGQ